MKLKKAFIFLVIIVVVCIATLLLWRPYLMIPSKYRMAVSVTILDENDPDFPVGTKYFDASEWLKQPQYIKSNDFRLINTDFVPVHEPIGFEITNRIFNDVIPDNQYAYPELVPLLELGRQGFYRLFKDKITWEYIYSKFNRDTLKPNMDYFLIRFPYKEQWYEVLLRRKPYKEIYSYMVISVLYGDGGWYKQNDIMTYKQYLAKQAAEKQDKK